MFVIAGWRTYCEPYRREAAAAERLAEAGATIRRKRFSAGWLHQLKDGVFGPDVIVVDLYHCKFDTDTFRQLADLRHLEVLRMQATTFDPSEFRYLRVLEGIRSVDLSHTPITSKAIAHLSDWSSLTYLNLADTAITDEGLFYLSRLSQLEQLCIAGTDVTTGGLSHLKGMQNLESLSIASTCIADAGFWILAQMPNLKVLCVDDRQISSGALRHLRSCKSLVQLDVQGTPMDLPAIYELADQMPALRISWGNDGSEVSLGP